MACHLRSGAARASTCEATRSYAPCASFMAAPNASRSPSASARAPRVAVAPHGDGFADGCDVGRLRVGLSKGCSTVPKERRGWPLCRDVEERRPGRDGWYAPRVRVEAVPEHPTTAGRLGRRPHRPSGRVGHRALRAARLRRGRPAPRARRQSSARPSDGTGRQGCPSRTQRRRKSPGLPVGWNAPRGRLDEARRHARARRRSRHRRIGGSARTIGLCSQGKGGFVQPPCSAVRTKIPSTHLRRADAHGRRDRQTGAFCPIAVLSEQTGPARILNHECQGELESSLELVHPSTDEDQ